MDCSSQLICVVALSASLFASAAATPEYHIYSGNTHSHTVRTWSHGEQYTKETEETGDKKQPGISVSPDGTQQAAKSKVLRADWKQHQGPPSEHYALAKANGYDFYIVTDHSQEAAFAPTSPTNTAWLSTKREAAEA